MIARTQHRNITEWLGKGKAIIVIGPRQVGKTTLVRQITQKLEQKVLWLTGDDPETRAQLDFWRTTSQQEIDYVEDANGQLHAFEFKLQQKKPTRFPAAFLENYPGSPTIAITQENFDAFVGI